MFTRPPEMMSDNLHASCTASASSTSWSLPRSRSSAQCILETAESDVKPVATSNSVVCTLSSVDEDQSNSPTCHVCVETLQKLQQEKKFLQEDYEQLETVNSSLRNTVEGLASARSGASVNREYETTTLLHQVDKLRRDIKEQENKLNIQDEEISKLVVYKDAYHDTFQEKNQLERDRKELQEKLSVMELFQDKYQTLRLQHCDWDSERKHLNEEISAITETEETLRTEIKQLHCTVAPLRKQITDQQHQYDALNQQYREQESTVATLRKQTTDQQHQYDVLNQQCQEQQRQATESPTLVEHVYQKLSEIQSCFAPINDIVRDTQEQQQSCLPAVYQNVQEMHKLMITQSTESGEVIDSNEAKFTEAEIEKKTTKLITLQDRLRSKKECLEQLNGQLQQMSSDLQCTEGEIEKKRNELRSKKECLEQLSGQLQQTSSNLQRTEYQLKSAERVVPLKGPPEVSTHLHTSRPVTAKHNTALTRSTEEDYENLASEYEDLTTCPDPDAVLGALEKVGMSPHDAKCVLSTAIQIFYDKSKEYLLQLMSQQLHKMFEPCLSADDRNARKKEMDLTSHAFGILLDVSGATKETHNPYSLEAAYTYLESRISEQAKEVFVTNRTPTNHCKILAELVWKFMVLSKPMILLQPKVYNANFVDKSVSWDERKDSSLLCYQRPVLFRSYSGTLSRQGWATNVCPESLSTYQADSSASFNVASKRSTPGVEKESSGSPIPKRKNISNKDGKSSSWLPSWLS